MAPLVPEQNYIDHQSTKMENREKEIIVEGQIDSIDNNVLEPSDNKLIEEVDAIKEDKPAPVLYWERLEKRYGKKIIEQLSLPLYEGAPQYISAVCNG